MYFFIIAALLFGNVFLAILGLLHVAKDLLANPFLPVPLYSKSEKDLDDGLPEVGQPARAASKDISLEREYSQ